MRICKAMSVIAMFVVPAIAGISAAQASPAPHTPAEMALDKVLKTADRDEEVLDNLLHRYPVAAAKRIDYRQWLTPKLIASLQAEEKKLVAQDCGGKYREGDICGIDYNPLTCAQDTVRPLSYKTVQQSADTAVIAVTGATYRMAHTSAGWQLDGVKCGGGVEVKFNFP
jgi:hypothetical protein